MKVGLVLEGGAMRASYTVGILDGLMDNNILVDYLIGVSAGASNGVSYVSGQRGRGYRIVKNYIKDKRYVSFSNFLKTKSMFGMDFIFEEIAHNLDPFDYEAFKKSKCDFVAAATDIETGKPVYFGKNDLDNDTTVLRASSSLPIFSPVVEYKGRKYLDGGTSDPIPVKKALEDGCDKVIVVLTREKGHVKSPEKLRGVYKRVLKKYPKMIDVLDNRHTIYNDCLKYVYDLEEKGKALVIAPDTPLGIGRFDKNIEKLTNIYNKGLSDIDNLKNKILDFIK